MAGAVQDMGNSTALSGCAGVRAGSCQRMTKDADQFITYAKMFKGKELSTQEFHVLRSKAFNIHSIRSVIITKPRTKSSEK